MSYQQTLNPSLSGKGLELLLSAALAPPRLKASSRNSVTIDQEGDVNPLDASWDGVVEMVQQPRSCPLRCCFRVG